MLLLAHLRVLLVHLVLLTCVLLVHGGRQHLGAALVMRVHLMVCTRGKRVLIVVRNMVQVLLLLLLAVRV